MVIDRYWPCADRFASPILPFSASNPGPAASGTSTHSGLWPMSAYRGARAKLSRYPSDRPRNTFLAAARPGGAAEELKARSAFLLLSRNFDAAHFLISNPCLTLPPHNNRTFKG